MIVTALLDGGTQTELDARQRRWFPPASSAHALPGARVDEVAAVLAEITDRAPIKAAVEALVSLGGGRAQR